MTFPRSILACTALLAGALSGCELVGRLPTDTDPAPDPAPSPASAIKAIRFGKHHGFCDGYCKVDLWLDPDGTGSVVYRKQDGGGAIGYDVVLSGAETKRLLALAEEAAQQPWNERYGCPDCVDQGAWPLEIETTRGAKKTSTLDPQAVPPFLKALTEALTAVIERHPRAPQVALCTASDRSASGVQVSDVHVEKDELRLAVAFGGGCEPHAFRLCWDGAFLESLPGQARLRLMHDARPDSCEALLRRDLAFDLGPVRRAYEAQYPGDRAKIIGLSIEGQPGSGARYEF